MNQDKSGGVLYICLLDGISGERNNVITFHIILIYLIK